MHLIILTMSNTVLLLYLYVGKDGEKIKKDLLEELPPESYFYIVYSK